MSNNINNTNSSNQPHFNSVTEVAKQFTHDCDCNDNSQYIKTYATDVDCSLMHCAYLVCDCGDIAGTINVVSKSNEYIKSKCSNCHSLLCAYHISNHLVTKILKPTKDENDWDYLCTVEHMDETFPGEWPITYELVNTRVQYIC